MNYIVRVKYDKNDSQYIVPTLSMMIRLEWEFIESIESNSLFDINKIISKMELPLINSMSFFRIHNYELIFREDMLDYIYLISDLELGFKQKIRNKRLTEILYERR